MKEVSRLDKLRQDLEKRWNDECDKENDRVEDMDEKMKYIDDLFNDKFNDWKSINSIIDIIKIRINYLC